MIASLEASYGYEPPAAKVADLVSSRLQRSGYPWLRSVICEAHDGLVVLSGRVPSFYMKQIAQVLASHTPGVRGVDNRLGVERRRS